MLKKIIAVKYVGRFRNSSAASNPQFAKHTLISGANGYGKTTICAILRSLQTGDSSYVIGRKTLGVSDRQSIELLLDTGNIRFNGTEWSATLPDLEIFDGTFIAQNVYSGEVVEIDQKRNLYRVIIGQEGVSLAEEEAQLSSDGRAKAGEISATTKRIQPFVPTDMKLVQFIDLNADPEIDSKIRDQQRALEAVRRAGQIAARSSLSEIHLPILPDAFGTLLTKTLEDVAANAEQQLANQLISMGMKTGGATWIAEGLAHVSDDRCPFCGQDIKELPLISAYRAVFSASYKALKTDVAEMKTTVSQLFGEGAVGRLETLAEQNKGNLEFWGRYCIFEQASLNVPDVVFSAMQNFGRAALALLDRKAKAPLDAHYLDTAFNETFKVYTAVQTELAKTNATIRSVNALIDAKKSETGTANVSAAESALAHLIAIKQRHEEVVSADCAELIRLITMKDAIEKRKAEVRSRLEEHTKQVVGPYEQKINDYLDSFNAGFRIAETKHGYPGGIATSSYQLVINSIPISVGDGKTPTRRPSFKNTLSAGDRTTLALAFFLAHLELDPEPSQKIVVFDDPFNSQDAFRRRQTVHEIIKRGRICAQVIVLSHEISFLKEIWKKATPSERVALQLFDARSLGTKISEIDLERACQGRMASEIDDLQAYLATGAGIPLDIIKKMRVVLETYCRTTFPACFCSTDWLGDIIGKTRLDAAHPAASLCDELEQINDYTKKYHHGEDTTDLTPDQIDADELTGFVRRTLRVANALQA